MSFLRRTELPPLEHVEEEIHQAVVRQFATPLPEYRTNLPMPEYVEHHPDANEIAKLASQAVAAQNEQSAKAAEEMGSALKDLLTRCDVEMLRLAKTNEDLKEKAQEALRAVEDAAVAFRDKAKVVFENIQNASILAEDVRRMCSQLAMQVQSGRPQLPPQEAEEHEEGSES
jgi:hypothetical protein